MEWSKAQAAERSGLQEYRAKLIKDGLTEAQADERIAIIPKLYREYPAYRTETAALGFNRL